MNNIKNLQPYALSMLLLILSFSSLKAQIFTDTAVWDGGSGDFGGEWSESGLDGWVIPGIGFPISWSDTDNPVTLDTVRVAIFPDYIGGGTVFVDGTVNVSRIELQGNYEIGFDFDFESGQTLKVGTLNLISHLTNEIVVGSTDGGGFPIAANASIGSDLTGSNGLDIYGGYRGARFGSTLTLSGLGTYTGDTSITDLAVFYDFTDAGNRLDPNSDLILREASVGMSNGGPDNASQTVATLRLDGGMNALSVDSYDTGDMGFEFGSLSRTELGAALLVSQTSPGGVTTDETNTNGLLHPSVILKDGTTYDWASVSGSKKLEAATYAADNFTGSTNNVDLSAGASLSDDTTINSLRIGATTGAESVTVAAGKTLTLTSGGLMQSADVGGTTTIDGGALTSPAQELMIYNFSDTYELQIDSAITGSGLNVSFLSDPDVESATIGLGGQNSFDGEMRINSASVRLDAGAQLNTDDLHMNGYSSLTLNESASLGGLRQGINATVTIGAGKTLMINETDFGSVGASATLIRGTIDGDGVLRKSGEGRAAILSSANVTTEIEVTGGDLRANPGLLNSINVSGSGRLVTFANLGSTTGDVTLDGGTLWIAFGTQFEGLTWNAGTVKGAGTLIGNFDVGAGKVIAPGESPGTTSFEAQTWSGGGSYEWEVTDVEGVAGTDWDLIQINQGTAGTQTLTITADSGNPFAINVLSLSDPESEGATANWDGSQTYAWVIAEAVDGITGFSEDAFSVDASQFASFNSFGGAFFVSLENSDTEIWLNYTPVPEPSAFALIVGLTGGIAALRRRGRESAILNK